MLTTSELLEQPLELTILAGLVKTTVWSNCSILRKEYIHDPSKAIEQGLHQYSSG